MASDSSTALQGQTWLITGPTNGIGKETAFAAAAGGATVVLGARNSDTARQLASDIRDRYPSTNVVIPRSLDLGQPDSIREFAKAYRQAKLPLHVLVNNAGANYDTAWQTKEGVTGLSQVNYHGPYTLTRLLEPVLIQSAPSRVVNISSIMHRVAFIKRAQDFMFKPRPKLYGQTKLAQVLFAYEHQRRLGPLGVQSCALDPGGVKSNIWRKSLFAKPPLKWVLDFFYSPTSDAAKVVLSAATQPWQPHAAQQTGAQQQGSRKRPPYLRFYARGMFASPLVYNFSPQPGWVGKLKSAAWGSSAVVHSLLDHPIRLLSRGLLASKAMLVPSSPVSASEALAKELWELSASTARLSPDPIRQ
jgi:WW domain-containing oxidoreductase